MSLGLVPKVFNAINVVVAIDKGRGMVNPNMMETRDIQGVVTGQGIGIDNAIGHNHMVDDRQQRGRFRIGNGGSIDLPAAFQNPEHRDFSGGASAPSPFSMAAKITFIDLDFSSKRTRLGQFFSNHHAQAMVKRKAGLA